MNGKGSILNFEQLEANHKFQTGWSAYTTIDGVALTLLPDSRKTFIDSKGSTLTPLMPKKQDRRTEANKKRIGHGLKRSGKYVRSNEVRRTVISWVNAIGGVQNVKFFTISFPCGTSNEIGKKVLNIMLTRWRKLLPDLSYLWTAEKQGNGTIHFHLVTNRFTYVRLLNSFVKASLAKHINEIPNYSLEDLEIYNGVDIGKKVYNKIGIEAYLAKYLTKAQQSGINQPWHRSRKMGYLATKIRHSGESVRSLFSTLKSKYINPEHRFRVFENDYCFYIEFPQIVSRAIQKHLTAYNRSRWKGVQKMFDVSEVPELLVDLEPNQVYANHVVNEIQTHLLHLFPVTHYQQRSRHITLS